MIIAWPFAMMSTTGTLDLESNGRNTVCCKIITKCMSIPTCAVLHHVQEAELSEKHRPEY